MKLYIPKDMFDNYHPPRLFLCTTGKKRIGELHNYETSLTGKWNSYSDLNFSIDRTYVDILTGETKVNPLFDKAEGLRMVLIEGMGYFVIQDPDSTYSDKDMKALSCFSSEYACAQKYLEQFYINTGEEDSKEVIYLSSIYGNGYTIDERYKLVTGTFDPYENYYIQQYTDTNSYVYEQVQITNEIEYKTYDGSTVAKTLYIQSYPNVRFYWPSKPELSLLHLVFEKIPEWSIGNVDATLWRKERKFSEERISVYDFLVNNVTDTFNCVVEWDTLTNTVNFYEEADDGISDDGTVQSRFETDVYISRENLATELNVSYSTDDIKTKLSISGSDNLDIREVNLGKNYIMNLDYYHNSDWMEPDLLEAYDDYLEKVEEYSPKYTASMQGWVAAYNKWNDLMNAVPAEGNVVLVGDEFKKLYCVYSPIDTAYLPQTIIDSNVNTLVVDNLYMLNNHTKAIDKTTLNDKDTFIVQGYSFVYVKTNNNFKCSENMDTYSLDKLTNIKDGKLHLYHVDEDIEANKNDNILLRLKNSSSDVATIRIYNSGTVASPTYLIQSIVVSASTGTSQAAKTYTMNQWVNGELTAEKMGFEGYKITYIGTMGAYFVLAKDETQESTLEEYGVNLLKEKHDTYVTIFQTQTEAMFSQQDYQCIVQNAQPEGDYDKGTKWLDADSNPVKLYEYDGSKNWTVISAEVSDTDQTNYENYQRYIDNYEKMVAVQEMLLKKEKEAGYWLNGYEVSGRVINYKKGDNDTAFYRAADAFFRTDSDSEDAFIITNGVLNVDLIPIYTFTTPKAEGNFAVYLIGNIPYVAYSESQGVYQSKMNAIAQETEFANSFTREQWIALSPLIREDEYSDDNFLLTGYESEEERLKICEELMESAAKELKTLSQPSLEFSMTMANILALPKFEPITSKFELGNFIRIELRPGIVKRARLLECTINFDDLSDFSCTFGNLITTKSEIDLHAELLQQAVTAGKTVATAASDWQSAVDKANKLEESIAGGLQDVALQIGRASGQAISWDDRGFFCRKFVDGSTDTYLDEQIAIINNKIVFTNDGWKTSKAALGEFEVDTNGDGIKERLYGLLADAVVSGYISGSVIEGGSLKIGGAGGKFVVNEDGSVEILGPDETPLYAGSSAVSEINDAYKYTVELLYNGSTVFASTEANTIVTAVVKDYGEDITYKLPVGSTFTWLRNGAVYKTTTITEDNKPQKDIINTNINSLTANQINITHTDIESNSFFSCQVDFDEKQIIIEGE